MLKVTVKKTLDYLDSRGHRDLVWFLHRTKELIPDGNENLKQMWREQIALNLPVLYLASVHLHNFVKKHDLKHLLFATRDCCHWYKIYEAMYPKEDIHYFHCSRNMFNTARINDREDYDKYIDNITGGEIRKSIYIDIHGTGKRMYDFFSEKGKGGPSCFILSSGHSHVGNLDEGVRDLIKSERAEFLVFGASGSPIEMLNYDIIGTCLDYNKYGPVRAALEYDMECIQHYHECVDTFIEIVKENRGMITKCKSGVRKSIKHLFKPALSDLPVISTWINPERTHEMLNMNILS